MPQYFIYGKKEIGFLSRTPRGRLATEAAYEHIGAAFPAKGEK